MNLSIAKLRALLFPLADYESQSGDRSRYERIPLPHSFKPELSFLAGVTAAFGAFFRIVAGAILFAFWGGYSLFLWSAIHNYFLRTAALLALFLLFLLSFALMMIAISALVRVCLPKRR
jgi:hypothetical protein